MPSGVETIDRLSSKLVHASRAAPRPRLDGSTDDAAAFQSLLDARAAEGGVDQGAALVSGFTLGGNTRVRCLPGVTVRLKAASNRQIFRNKNPDKAARTDSGIRIEGGLYDGRGFTPGT